MSNKTFVNDLMALSPPFGCKEHSMRTPETDDSLSSNKENASSLSKKSCRRKKATARLPRKPLTQKKNSGSLKASPEHFCSPSVVKSIDFRYFPETDFIILPLSFQSPVQTRLRGLPR